MRKRALIAAALPSLLVLLAPPLDVADARSCPPGQPPGRPPGQAPGQDTSGRPESYGPGTCELRLSRSVGTAGTAFQASGSGFRAGSDVTVTFESDPVVLATVTANASGAFTVGVAVPEDAEPGQHTVRASGVGPDGEPHGQSAAFTVLDDGAGGEERGSPGGPATTSGSSTAASDPGSSTASQADGDGGDADALGGTLSARATGADGDDDRSEDASSDDADAVALAADGSSSGDGGSGVITGIGLSAIVAATLAGIAVSRRRRAAAS